MKKNRIVTRVKDRTGLAKSKNRNEDLADLRVKYAKFSKNLKFLISTLVQNRAAALAHSKARLEVAKAVNSLTVDTPLFRCGGDIPASAVGTADGGGEGGADVSEAVVPYQKDPTSYAAIHLQLHKKHKMYGDKYTEHIVTYAKAWQSILDARVAKHLKQAESLRVDLDHYGKKVDDLNRTVNKTMSRGKAVSDAGADKVKRNEQKLVAARREYDRFVNDLCGFLDEVLDRGWKDLHPLLVKMAQFDATLSGEEAGLLKGSMAAVTAELKGMGARHPGLSPGGRLKELEHSSLESLNRAGGGGGPLAIQQGGGEVAQYVGRGEGAFPGGIHAGLGDGGAGGPSGGGLSHSGSGLSHSGSYNGSEGGYGAPARTDSGGGQNWAAGAPAGSQPYPSEASLGGSVVRSPSSGGLPPLRPPAPVPPGQHYRAQDMSPQALGTSGLLRTMQRAAPPPTMDDVYSAAAPAPAGMPPPPPSLPPPPPPSAPSPHLGHLSLYGAAPGGAPPASPMGSVAGGGAGTNPFDAGFVAPPPAGAGAPQGYGGRAAGTNPFG